MNESGQVVAKVDDDGKLLNERDTHRLRSFAKQHRPLFWQDTGERVKLLPFVGRLIKKRT